MLVWWVGDTEIRQVAAVKQKPPELKPSRADVLAGGSSTWNQDPRLLPELVKDDLLSGLVETHQVTDNKVRNGFIITSTQLICLLVDFLIIYWEKLVTEKQNMWPVGEDADTLMKTDFTVPSWPTEITTRSGGRREISFKVVPTLHLAHVADSRQAFMWQDMRQVNQAG